MQTSRFRSPGGRLPESQAANLYSRRHIDLQRITTACCWSTRG